MRLLFFLVLFCSVPTLRAQWTMIPPPDQNGFERVVDLRGSWQFRLGDDLRWASAPDDGQWETVFAPSAWEDEGYWGYDGYAWYRKTFRLSAGATDRPLYLLLGRIDDVDEVWVNGAFVGGRGRSEPDHETAYHHFRAYRVPAEVLRPGRENVVTIRVLDFELQGGLLEGQLGLFVRPSDPPLEIDLAGRWRFRPGDDPAFREPSFDDRRWSLLTVPAHWEPQGFRNYNGYGWYRISFRLKDFDGQDRLLLLGLIDDLDEAYLNGQRVGGTGRIDRRQISGDEWQQQRVYRVRGSLLREGTNTLAVRVYDNQFGGGIWDGTLGVARVDVYDRWQRAQGVPWWNRLRVRLGLQ